MPKQGVHSVGVAQQYCGRLGKVANCQAGMFVVYAGAGGTMLVHRRLALLTELMADGSLPARWVSCDEGYGQSVAFLDGVADLGLGCMAEATVDTRLWPERPPTVVLGPKGERLNLWQSGPDFDKDGWFTSPFVSGCLRLSDCALCIPAIKWAMGPSVPPEQVRDAVREGESYTQG